MSLPVKVDVISVPVSLSVVVFQSEMFIYDYATGAREFQLPLEVGSIIGFSGLRKDTEVVQLCYRS